MAEIEYFHDPVDKNHPKFESVKDVEATFYSVSNQLGGELPHKNTFGEAVATVTSNLWALLNIAV